jgi:hypothetical protein
VTKHERLVVRFGRREEEPRHSTRLFHPEQGVAFVGKLSRICTPRIARVSVPIKLTRDHEVPSPSKRSKP